MVADSGKALWSPSHNPHATVIPHLPPPRGKFWHQHLTVLQSFSQDGMGRLGRAQSQVASGMQVRVGEAGALEITPPPSSQGTP